MKLPDFLIIGVQRAGTTFLRSSLNRHPDIEMTEWKHGNTHNEVHFFTKNWELGIDWYKGLFNGKCSGEKTPEYIFSKVAIKRISQVVPNAKLIVSLRDPVERAYSQYRMLKNYNNLRRLNISEPVTMEKIIRNKNNQCVERGYYFRQISSLLKYFPRENLHIVIFEQLIEQPDIEMNKIYSFLKLSPCHLKNGEYKKDEIDVKAEPSNNLSDGFGLEQRRKLADIYQKDTNRLYHFLGYNVEEWRL